MVQLLNFLEQPCLYRGSNLFKITCDSSTKTLVKNQFAFFLKNCQSAYSPPEYITINEQLLAFRGLCRF